MKSRITSLLIRVLLILLMTEAVPASVNANPQVHALVSECKELHKQYDHEKAVQACTKALAIDPHNLDALFYRGFIHQYNNRYKQAIDDFTALLGIKNDDMDALAWRGRSLMETSQLEAALTDLNRVISLNPQYSLAVYIDRATIHQALGNNDLFYRDYQVFISRQPSTADDYLTLGSFWDTLGKPEQSIVQYSNAIKLNPKSPRAYWSRAGAYFKLNQYQAALDDFAESINRAPRNAVGYMGRAYMLWKLNRPNQALQDISKAIELEPGDANNYILRTELYRVLNMPDKLLDDINVAARLAPQNSLVFFIRADVLWHSFNKKEEALRDFQHAHALSPAESGITLQLATLHDTMGNKEQAIKYFEKFLATAPTNDSSRVSVIARLGYLKGKSN